MKIKELTEFLENFAPIYLQEEYDNCGLTVGAEDEKIKNILICVDVTLEVIEEAKTRTGAVFLVSAGFLAEPLMKNQQFMPKNIKLCPKIYKIGFVILMQCLLENL